MTEFATPPYRIDFASYNAFVLTWLKRTFYTRHNLTRFLLLAGLATVVGYWNGKGFASPIGMIGWALLSLISGLIVSAILVYVVAPMLIWLWQMLGFLLGGTRKGLQALSLGDDGVVKTMDQDSHTYGWDQIHDVVETHRALLLFTGRNSAMIVPRTAFANSADVKTFAERVVERAFRQPHPQPDKNF